MNENLHSHELQRQALRQRAVQASLHAGQGRQAWVRSEDLQVLRERSRWASPADSLLQRSLPNEMGTALRLLYPRAHDCLSWHMYGCRLRSTATLKRNVQCPSAPRMEARRPHCEQNEARGGCLREMRHANWQGQSQGSVRELLPQRVLLRESHRRTGAAECSAYARPDRDATVGRHEGHSPVLYQLPSWSRGRSHRTSERKKDLRTSCLGEPAVPTYQSESHEAQPLRSLIPLFAVSNPCFETSRVSPLPGGATRPVFSRH